MKTLLSLDNIASVNAVKSCLLRLSPFGSVRSSSLLSLIATTFLALVSATVQAQTASDDFVLKITTTEGTNPTDKSFTFYSQDRDYMVDWGEGSGFEQVSTGDALHTFSTAGVHTIRFRNLNDVFINSPYYPVTGRKADRGKYTSIEQWGTAVWNADMGGAFQGASNLTMNASAGTPDMSAVVNMGAMFARATSFNGDIGGWNTAKVTNMSWMFEEATAFNQDIGNWNTAQVMSMGFMFDGATSFNQDIGNWNTAQVTNMEGMFEEATSFNQDIGNWNTAKVMHMRYVFSRAFAFNGDIGRWNVASVISMSSMFEGAISFNGDIGRWNVASVIGMSSMFRGATVFDQDIGGWNIEAVTSMSSMFSGAVYGATSFNQDIGNWNTAKVTEMQSMFYEATSFNQDIGGWNTAKVTNMYQMFDGATSFNGDIGGWNTAQVANMGFMFQRATVFNQDIGNWNTAKVTHMGSMFGGATAFNQDIGNWNTAKVTYMGFMFWGVTAFNQDIGNWNTAQVTEMSYTFSGATSFNQDIGNWNTAKVTEMSYTFSGATSFNQDIGNWNTAKVTDMEGMFSNATLSIANYDSLLVGWNRQTLQTGVTFHGGNSLYLSTQAQTARANMISSDGWSITDRGLRTMNQAPTNIFLSSHSIAENAGANAVVGMLSNTDTGGTYAYTLVAGGRNNGSFNISGTTLRLTASADLETKYSYSVRINVNDGTHNFAKTFRINVDDVNEAPTASDAPFVVAENSANGTAVGTAPATDPDFSWQPNGILTYAFTGGNTGDIFAVNPRTGAITVAGVLDYETFPSYSLVVTVTDGGSPSLSATARLTITVTDVNDPPVFAGGPTATVAYAENATTAVPTITATDADAGQTVTFTLSGGADMGLFSITSAGELTFNTAPDFEMPTDVGGDNMYEVIVTATDDGTTAMTATQALTITVTDVNEHAPVFTTGTTVSYAENATTAVATVIATDADTEQTVRFTLSGADASNFSITPAGELTFNTAPDFEMPTDVGGDNMYEVIVTATDGQTSPMTATQTLTITVTDENDNAPVFTEGTTASVSYAENGTTSVTTVVAADADAGQTVSYTLTGGADEFKFSITPAGALTFNTAPDFEMPTDTGGDNDYEVIVTATDGQTPPMTATQTLTITVTDVNDNAPVFTEGTTASVSYAENGTTSVTTVVAADADAGQTVSYTLTGGADEFKFSITPAGELTFDTSPDFEIPTDAGGDNDYEVIVTATDGQTSPMTATQTLTITVTDANDNAPVFTEGTTASVSYAENGTTSVTTVVAADADAGQTVSFTLTGGADEFKFSITPAGELTFDTSPDFEIPTDTGGDNDYDVIVTATDGQTPPMTATQTLTITVTDVDELTPSDDFVLKITTNPGTNANDMDFTFYTEDINYDIDWNNDGTFEAPGVSGNQSHTFATAGVHTIRFKNLNDVYINDQADEAKYTSIVQWGTAVWDADMSSAFRGAINLTMTATDKPDMRLVTNMTSMFAGASSFDGDISGWNVASVTDMSYMFRGASAFNSEVGGWNVSSVTTMAYMFAGASSFDQTLVGWNTASVTDMAYMFRGASSFNGEVGDWNVASVTNMRAMFSRATAFNSEVVGWNVSSVTDMSVMFWNVEFFDQDLGGWDVASVTDMNGMFQNAASFNQDLGGWNTAQVTSMGRMFRGASSFNGAIGRWTVASVTDMSYMFRGASSFNGAIGGWTVASVTDMSYGHL